MSLSNSAGWTPPEILWARPKGRRGVLFRLDVGRVSSVCVSPTGDRHAPDTDLLQRELTKIQSLSLSDLRRGYRKHLRAEPPECFGHDLLRRAIAHAIEQTIHKATVPRQ